MDALLSFFKNVLTRFSRLPLDVLRNNLITCEIIINTWLVKALAWTKKNITKSINSTSDSRAWRHLHGSLEITEFQIKTTRLYQEVQCSITSNLDLLLPWWLPIWEFRSLFLRQKQHQHLNWPFQFCRGMQPAPIAREFPIANTSLDASNQTILAEIRSYHLIQAPAIPWLVLVLNNHHVANLKVAAGRSPLGSSLEVL